MMHFSRSITQYRSHARFHRQIRSFSRRLFTHSILSKSKKIIISLFDMISPICNRDFKIQRRGRRRERKKRNRFYKKNNNFARASRFFVHFFARFCTTTTWKCLISRFMEYVNKQQRDFTSLSKLGWWSLGIQLQEGSPTFDKVSG